MDEPLVPGQGRVALENSSNALNVATLSGSFFLLFTGYTTLQGYLSTTLPGNTGFQSLSILYGSYLFFLFFAPAICLRLGDKAAMLTGSTCYVVFLGSLITQQPTVVLVASVLTGFGASVLWVAQGNFITMSSNDSNRGRIAGMFWACMQASAIVGPAVSYFLLSFLKGTQNGLDTTMYTVFTSVAAFGAILLLTLRKPALVEQSSIQGVEPSDGQRPGLVNEVCGPLLRVLQLCLKRDITLMLSACFFIGIEMSFVTGEFFRLTMLLPCYYADYIDMESSGTANETLCDQDEATGTCMWDVEREACTKDPSVVGLVFIAFGLGDCIGAFVLGWLSDGSAKGGTPLRRKLVVTLGMLCYGGALALVMVFKHSQHEILPRFPPKAWLPQEEKALSWMCFITAGLFGVNDAAWNTQIYAALGSTAPKDGVHVFTIYQMFQQLGMVTGFCMPLLWPLETSDVQVYVQIGFVSLAWLTFMCCRLPTRRRVES